MPGTEYAFDVFEVVEVVADTGVAPVGASGVVLGRSRGDDGSQWYAIRFDGGSDVCMASRDDLCGTGRQVEREDIYDGSSIRVSRHGEPV